jgi:signal transduction histidine kinase
MEQGGMRPAVRRGLSAKLLKLTSLFVMLAVVLVYVPALATFYERWLNDRIGRAHSVALVLDAAPEGMVPETLARRLLDSVGARLIVLKTGETRRLLAASDTPPAVARDVDLREPLRTTAFRNAFAVMFSDGKGVMRLVGDAPRGGEFIEVLVEEKPLRASLLRFSRNMLGMSLAVAALAGVLLYLLMDRMIVRPVRRLTGRMVAFGQDPENPDGIIVPSGSNDEIGVAEEELAAMQTELHGQLQSKGHLAALGLAVSKINHDLRNLLAAAQLASERLADSPDPAVKRLSGKLVSTLERAVAYCTTTLNYGAAREATPQRRPVEVADLIDEMRDALGLSQNTGIGWTEAVERGLTVDADPDQLFRVLLNLVRNAVQALESRPKGEGFPLQIRITGRREGTVAIIEVSDTGPGVPAKAREHLFEAFQTSGRPGGSGLGLAIAAELVRAHDGDIHLVEGTIGATFRISIPDRPVELQTVRNERARA